MAAPVLSPIGAFDIVVNAVSNLRGVTRAELIGYIRTMTVSMARHEVCYLLRTYASLSLNQIAGLLGDRDHTTILHSVQRVEARLRTDPAYPARFAKLIAILEPALSDAQERSLLALMRRAAEHPERLSTGEIQTLGSALLGVTRIIGIKAISDAECRTACRFILEEPSNGR